MPEKRVTKIDVNKLPPEHVDYRVNLKIDGVPAELFDDGKWRRVDPTELVPGQSKLVQE